MTADKQKQNAAEAALKILESGRKIGLGTGTTANYFIEAAAKKVKAEKLDIVFVPTSLASYNLAVKLGLTVKNLEEVSFLDFTVDGADEFDAKFRLIKGGGGAMHREKLVASSSKFMIAICDTSKQVKTLGKFPLPVEVSRFGVNATAWKLERAFEHLKLKAKMKIRTTADGKPFITELGNPIIDCNLNAIPEPEQLDGILNNTPGVIETGLFIGICGIVMMGTDKGVKEFTRG